jgi:hypothetical protein
MKKDLTEFVTPNIQKMLLTHAMKCGTTLGSTNKSMTQNTSDIGSAFQLNPPYEEGAKYFYTCHGGFYL